jgi:uncharacterized protein (DUF2461 family)
VQVPDIKDTVEAQCTVALAAVDQRIESAVMAFLKAKQTIQHRDLLVELKAMRTTPVGFTSRDLKRLIESLVDRAFVIRDQQDGNVYHYIP